MIHNHLDFIKHFVFLKHFSQDDKKFSKYIDLNNKNDRVNLMDLYEK